jgi:ABC-type multidrug transport system fused ATPase/permease subunit
MLSSFFKLLSRCYRLALPYGRVKLFAVLGLIFFNGLLQLIGVSSVFPFFALAADPDRIRRSSVGAKLLSILPPMDTNQLLVAAGCFAIAMLLLSSIGSLITEVVRIRYAFSFCQWLRQRIFESYSSRPYAYFLQRNSSELYQKLWDVATFIGSVLLPLGEVISRIVLTLFLVSAVFIVQPWVAFGALVLFGGFYLIVFLWLRPRTKAVTDGMHYNSLNFGKNTYQFLHGIKPLLVHDRSRYLMGKALKHSEMVGYYQSMVPIYSNGPRYLVEPLAFGGLVAIVVVLALQGRPFSDILPNLSVMAIAGYRLLPSLQMLYSQLVNVTSNMHTLSQLEEELFSIEDEFSHSPVRPSISLEPLSFKREILLDKITFQYPAASTPTISSLTLAFHKNESIGIAGPSGSGKSTLIDLLLGLHLPIAGQILVDGVPLTHANMASWRSMIGYVPQDIYLMDETIAENIAFGIEPSSIDPDALRKAAQAAQILDFIERELPKGFQTVVGERGVRLSGGQRQRIGLARALYHKPQILILDEATSALDHQTEAAVMETINHLQGTMTIITIAHRLTTLDRCDHVIQLQKAPQNDSGAQDTLKTI